MGRTPSFPIDSSWMFTSRRLPRSNTSWASVACQIGHSLSPSMKRKRSSLRSVVNSCCRSMSAKRQSWRYVRALARATKLTAEVRSISRLKTQLTKSSAKYGSLASSCSSWTVRKPPSATSSLNDRVCGLLPAHLVRARRPSPTFAACGFAGARRGGVRTCRLQWMRLDHPLQRNSEVVLVRRGRLGCADHRVGTTGAHPMSVATSSSCVGPATAERWISPRG